MNTNDVPTFAQLGFDTQKYYQLQKQGILERLEKFKAGRLYLEIGGKFLYDPHAARVLPGFDPYIKQKIIADLHEMSEIIYAVDWDAIISDRQMKNVEQSYQSSVIEGLQGFKDNLNIPTKIAINRCRKIDNPIVEDFIVKLHELGYETYKRYYIPNYPKDIATILSGNGFGGDKHIPVTKPLVLLTSPGSNSGKMSTALGQIYLDQEQGVQSGYAKYELFPIWNLSIKHPVNLAYEASTADIGDFNVPDLNHKNTYGIEATSYNRDFESFNILKDLANKFVSHDNHIKNYLSTTDMGINYAGFAITDDKVVSLASLEEIKRRTVWYQEIVNRGDGKLNWVIKCQQLERDAFAYCKEKEYL